MNLSPAARASGRVEEKLTVPIRNGMPWNTGTLKVRKIFIIETTMTRSGRET